MPIKLVTFRDWTFELDFERTYEVYQSVELGSPEKCSCNGCKNFVAQRDKIYPPEFRALLHVLGADHHKEAEVFHVCKLENGLHWYEGCFHFKGKVVDNVDNSMELSSALTRLEILELNSHFELMFLKSNHLSFFGEDEELIQIEFKAMSEWVIDENLEPEY